MLLAAAGIATPAIADPAAAGPSSDDATEFGDDGRLLLRVVACAGDEPVPDRLARVVDHHCKALDKTVASYRTRWLDPARPFLAGLVPADLPDHVIYPFGGNDLLTALATFPDAREISILALERGSDPRRLARAPVTTIAASLERYRGHLAYLMRYAFHKTTDMMALRSDLLGSALVGALAALAVHERELVSLRFFTLDDAGTPVYRADRFDSFEITFRRPGGPLQTFRHLSANLSNDGLKRSPGVIAYLHTRAPYAAMTKASSYLLAMRSFTRIRDLLLADMVWMISDSTGPQPRAAHQAGFEQVAYGVFLGPVPAFHDLAEAWKMVELWKHPAGPAPVHYGYGDRAFRAHLLITRKPAAAAP